MNRAGRRAGDDNFASDSQGTVLFFVLGWMGQFYADEILQEELMHRQCAMS